MMRADAGVLEISGDDHPVDSAEFTRKDGKQIQKKLLVVELKIHIIQIVGFHRQGIFDLLPVIITGCSLSSIIYYCHMITYERTPVYEHNTFNRIQKAAFYRVIKPNFGIRIIWNIHPEPNQLKPRTEWVGRRALGVSSVSRSLYQGTRSSPFQGPIHFMHSWKPDVV